MANPTLQTLEQISRQLGCTVASLLEGETSPPPVHPPLLSKRDQRILEAFDGLGPEERRLLLKLAAILKANSRTSIK